MLIFAGVRLKPKTMNKFFSLLTFLLLSAVVTGQQVPREQVVLEIGTGTWCQYCPGASMAAEDLINAGYNVAVIKNHNGDAYTNAASNYRNSYYNITGYPTARFDGLTPYVGGSNSQSLFSAYLPYVNARNNVPSSFTISIEGSVTGGVYTANITATRVATYTNNNLKLHLVLTESEIQENWQGQTELNWVQRMMIPNHFGTALDFTTQTTHNVSLNFTPNPEWKVVHMELVAFLQNDVTKEITQATKIPLSALLPTLNIDLANTMVANVPAKVGFGRLSPEVHIQNLGAENITSAEIHYMVNNETPMVYNWTGDLAYLDEDIVNLPEVDFTLEMANSIKVYISNPNNQNDLNPVNDTINTPFVFLTNGYEPSATLVIKTDNNPGETTWELQDGSGTVLQAGGPYTTPNTVSIVPLTPTALGNYRFIFKDSGNNGICCMSGNGMYKIADKNNQTIVSGGAFYGTHTTDFSFGTPVGIVQPEVAGFKVYPNPASGYVKIELEQYRNDFVNISISDIAGRRMIQQQNMNMAPGFHQIELNTSNLSDGVYLLQIEVNGSRSVQKLIIRK